MGKHPFTIRVINIVHSIPEGCVTTYGRVAEMAGNRAGARQVSRILHSCAEKENLPWHRVVNRKGQISLPLTNGYDIQKSLLQKEGVKFTKNDVIPFEAFLWQPAGNTGK